MKPPYRDRRLSLKAECSDRPEWFHRVLNPAPGLDVLAEAIAYFERLDDIGDAPTPQSSPPPPATMIVECDEIFDMSLYDQVMHEE
jgi:hypothetical protein